MNKSEDKIRMVESYGPLQRNNVYRVVERHKYWVLVSCGGKNIYVFPNLVREYHPSDDVSNVPDYQLPTYEEVVRDDFGHYFDKN